MAESNNKNTSGRSASHFASPAGGENAGKSGSHFGSVKTQSAKTQSVASAGRHSGASQGGASHLKSVEPTIRKSTGSRFASKHGASAGGAGSRAAATGGTRFASSSASKTRATGAASTGGRRFASGSKAAGSTSAGATQGVQPVAPVRGASVAKQTGTQKASHGLVHRGDAAGSRHATGVGVSAQAGRGGRKAAKAADPARKKRAQVLSMALIVVGVALLLVAGGLFIKAQLGYQEAQSTYSDLEQYAVKSEDGDDIPAVDFDALAAINPDIVGWIYIPGTVINYPVVQTSDNTTYLSKLFDLKGNGSGTIFMDMDCTSPGLVDQQTTLYGHHMNDGSMFKAIDGTLDQAEFDKIGNIYYITRDTTYVLKAMFTAQVEDTYINARTPNFTDDDTTLQTYLADMLNHAKATSSTASEDIQSADKVLTLVTCAGEIIPRTTRAAMVCKVVETQDRTGAATTDDGTTDDGSTDEAASADGTDAAAQEQTEQADAEQTA